jgi:hypothetical protein
VSDPQPIDALNLSGLSRNRLHRAAIHTTGDLLTWTEDDLLRLNGFGAGMLSEVTAALSARGMRLAGEPAVPATGAKLIAAERRRQVEAEGWTPEHDAQHAAGELARAAACYALPQRERTTSPGLPFPRGWPWGVRAWKPEPGDRVRELVKAGGLIAAEIDRLLAAAEVPQ